MEKMDSEEKFSSNEDLSDEDSDESQNDLEYEVTGVHIPSRKKYILAYCSRFDSIDLVHQKNKKYSKRAIAVKHYGKLIGYITEGDLDEVHRIIKNPFSAYISEINYTDYGFSNSYLRVYVKIEI